ncbi:MAG: AlkA N-terminal domain-containing protein [Woeseiaceae bacterium]|jgi:AraC family transcriptional regulator of adaptative response / DNA-3-methyladenine glycosylase II
MQQHEIYERARLSRDARFDGQFFVGVKTTGIYCRPICPAVTPKSENVAFYPSAAAAGEAGFRPCLRCRPESAPGTPAWSGTSTTVRRGLRLIANGALDDGSIEQLADRLGVTSRHLRRLFNRHLGASPLAIAHTQRLHFAKQLIDETRLPMSNIAVAAGYGSVRRFNDTFRKTYGRSPRELRRRSDAPGKADSTLKVHLPWRKPFDWAAISDFLVNRATPGVECMTGAAYLRTVLIDGRPGVIECRPDSERATVCLTLHGVATRSLFPVVQRVRELLDLDAPLTDIARVLGEDPLLAGMLRQRPDVRVPGAWSGFELAVRAVLGQQISVKAATTLAGRIAERYGERFQLPETLRGREDAMQLTRLFPAATTLSRARFNSIGITGRRAATLRRLARAVASGRLDFDSTHDPDELYRSLIAIEGIGDWTAQYVAMRGLKYPDAFPATDLGLLKATGSTAAQLRRQAEAWRPWRAYAAMLIWGSLSNPGG